MTLLGEKASLLTEPEEVGVREPTGPVGSTAKEALQSLNYWLLLVISSSYVGRWLRRWVEG